MIEYEPESENELMNESLSLNTSDDSTMRGGGALSGMLIEPAAGEKVQTPREPGQLSNLNLAAAVVIDTEGQAEL